MNKEYYKELELLKSISITDLQIHESHLDEINDSEAFQKLRALIIRRVEELIDADFQYLMHLLYRADVNERLLKERLSEGNDAEAATIIADSYIERQLGKLKTRGSSDPDWDFDI